MQFQSYAERHRLPAELAASLTRASLVTSAVVCGLLAAVAWLADIVPIVAHSGQVLPSTTSPLMLTCWALIFIGAVAATAVTRIIAGKRNVVKMVYKGPAQPQPGDAQTSGSSAAQTEASGSAHKGSAQPQQGPGKTDAQLSGTGAAQVKASGAVASPGMAQWAAKNVQSLPPGRGASKPDSESSQQSSEEGLEDSKVQEQVEGSSERTSGGEGYQGESRGQSSSSGPHTKALKAVANTHALSTLSRTCDHWGLRQQTVGMSNRMRLCSRARLLQSRAAPSQLAYSGSVVMQVGVACRSPVAMQQRAGCASETRSHVVARLSVVKTAASSRCKPCLANL
jgi:hypothetical protein